MHRGIILFAPLSLTLAACGSDQTDQQGAAADPEATATASVAAIGQKAVELPLTAQAFVDAAAASEKFEIESARIVQGAGPAQPLAAFTQTMLRDHQASLEMLKTAAGAGDGTAYPDDQKLTDEQKANLAALRDAGGEMGALYLRQQLAAHEQTLAILKTYAASGDNQALMAYANKAIPLVSHHLEALKKLAAQ